MRRRDDKFPDNGFEAWGGYMNAKISKLEEQFASRVGSEQEVLSDIFSGVSIYVNGYTIPSADELKTLMAKHGGVYHTYQRSDDFIIASNLPDTKVKNMSLVKVVRPEWITDSIAASKLLDYRDYLLYGNSRLQPRLNFAKVKSDPVVDCKPSTSMLESTVIKDHDEKLIDFPIVDTKQANVTGDLPKRTDHSTKTAADPNFISEFYNNSRLHHISQLGACFKQHVNDLRETSNFQFPARTQLKERVLTLNNANCLSQVTFEGGKTIMHIDMDCFFVSVGLRKRPDLRGKPVAVTHSKGGQGRPKRAGVDRDTEFNLYREKQAKKLVKATGIDEDIKLETRVDAIGDEDDKYGSMSEIASCSYEARAKGIGNGMFMGAALRLCPDLQTIPYDFDGYKEVAYTLYNTVAQYTLNIEAVSCDEMYVDCSELLKDLDITVQDFATILREEIRSKTGCPCSTGFGGNRLQARLATKRAKPDGQFFLSADLVEDFIFNIKLRDLPGVGRQTASKLESLGHQTCGSLQSFSLTSLQHHLGMKTGLQLYDQCRGRDNNALTFHTVRKSVSAEVNYGIRFENNQQCIEFLKQLSAEVHTRMVQFKVVGKCITLKLMVRDEEAPVETAKFLGHGFCNVINKSTSLLNATNDAEIITKEIISLCNKQKIDPKEMRGIGIQVTKLESLANKGQTKGAMSKYLVNTNSVKCESKNTIDHPVIANKVKPEPALKPATPKKTKAQSPKKSPVIGSNKTSPVASGKRRGRPPKNLSLKAKASTSKNLMSKFLHGQNTYNPPYKPPIPLQVQTVVKQEKKEVKKEAEKVEKESAPNQGLLDLPWDKVRELLRAWLESGQTPLPYDINLIITYMREMVINKNIDKLNILLNFVRRRIREMDNSSWMEVYENIMEQVQNAMVAVYGKKLWVGT
ncbi:DNA repair protein Rev1 [Leguminivora glycinivorella]|uniref:DNA repair protein Rev1 n=1 Tax=Leguminivora glycinivorella TaxID=1035111 RepID=UPI00200DDFBE|nr:DNA repair protein Rev1 [Leguminivora glycinivorella]